LADAINDLQE
jgi:hypothetical protein